MRHRVGAVLSPLDESRFGIRTARALFEDEADVDAALAYSEQSQVPLLIARVPATSVSLVHRLERDGFQLMDTLVHYRKDLRKRPTAEIRPTLAVRPLDSGEIEQIVEIARCSFMAYRGHYHADPRLDQALCDQIYPDWARRLCSDRDPAAEVLVAEDEGRPAGFSALRFDSAGRGEVLLSAVHPEARGKSIYRQLVLSTVIWCQEHSCECIERSTQITNRQVQRVWARCGFELDRAEYTLHKWFS